MNETSATADSLSNKELPHMRSLGASVHDDEMTCPEVEARADCPRSMDRRCIARNVLYVIVTPNDASHREMSGMGAVRVRPPAGGQTVLISQ